VIQLSSFFPRNQAPTSHNPTQTHTTIREEAPEAGLKRRKEEGVKQMDLCSQKLWLKVEPIIGRRATRAECGAWVDTLKDFFSKEPEFSKK